MFVSTSTNGDGKLATFVVPEVGVEEGPCVVSATSAVKWASLTCWQYVILTRAGLS